MTSDAMCQRADNGLTVKLWILEGNPPTVTVKDERTGENFAIECQPQEALDCYYHPFAYRARAEASCGSS